MVVVVEYVVSILVHEGFCLVHLVLCGLRALVGCIYKPQLAALRRSVGCCSSGYCLRYVYMQAAHIVKLACAEDVCCGIGLAVVVYHFHAGSLAHSRPRTSRGAVGRKKHAVGRSNLLAFSVVRLQRKHRLRHVLHSRRLSHSSAEAEQRN